jgi:hypothetical protein
MPIQPMSNFEHSRLWPHRPWCLLVLDWISIWRGIVMPITITYACQILKTSIWKFNLSEIFLCYLDLNKGHRFYWSEPLGSNVLHGANSFFLRTVNFSNKLAYNNAGNNMEMHDFFFVYLFEIINHNVWIITIP